MRALVGRTCRRLDDRYRAVVMFCKRRARAMTESSGGGWSLTGGCKMGNVAAGDNRLQCLEVPLGWRVRGQGRSGVRGELREDVGPRGWGEGRIGRRPRWVELKGDVEEVGRHQVELQRRRISSECGGWANIGIREVSVLFNCWSSRADSLCGGAVALFRHSAPASSLLSSTMPWATTRRINGFLLSDTIR